MIRMFSDPTTSEEAAEYISELEGMYPAPDWAVVYGLEEIETDDEGAVLSEVITIAKRDGGVLHEQMEVYVGELVEIEEDGEDWVELVRSALEATEDELAEAETQHVH